MVQAEAVSQVPAGVTAITRPTSGGARRTVHGLRAVPDADLIHGLDVDLPFRASCPTVTTVHDLSVFDTPWAFSSYRVAGERLIVRRSIAKADAIIAVSAFTAERVNHHFGRTATVVPLAPRSTRVPSCDAATDRVRDRYDLPPRFVLQLASIEPRKNVQLLAEVCAALDVPLVLAGGRVGETPVPASARHLGYVPQGEIAPLLDAAEIVAYISDYEGFGLPPLEAMARARPVVASAVGGLPNLPGGLELVPVGDRTALHTALRGLWHDADRRSELAAAGQRTAAAMTWSANADATLEVYRSLGVSA